jgi:hypothetical protein
MRNCTRISAWKPANLPYVNGNAHTLYALPTRGVFFILLYLQALAGASSGSNEEVRLFYYTFWSEICIFAQRMVGCWLGAAFW